MKRLSLINKIFILGLLAFACLSLISTSACFAQPAKLIPAVIHTPSDLAQWLKQDFTYVTEFPDYWQPAQETIELKQGDCEDFAILAQSALKQMGTSSDIVIIHFQGLKLSHAICLFKEGDFYSFISNRKIIRTHTSTVNQFLEEQYPNWESVTFATAQKETLQVLSKNQNKGISLDQLSPALP